MWTYYMISSFSLFIFNQRHYFWQVHTDEQQTVAENDLKKAVCDTYQGEKPAACGAEGLWNFF